MEKESFKTSHQYYLYNEEIEKLYNITLECLKNECKNNANEHGYLILWDKNNYEKYQNENMKILSIGDALSLCHSELSEALEAYRDNDKEHFSEEIADEFIRLFHLCGDLKIDIEKAIYEKIEKNKTRPKNHGRKNF